MSTSNPWDTTTSSWDNNSSNNQSLSSLPDTGSMDLGAIAPIFGIAGAGSTSADYLDINIHGKSFSQQLFYNSGTFYLGGIFTGGIYGVFAGMRDSPSSKMKIKLNSILNASGQQGSKMGNSLGVLAMMYTGVEHVAENYLELDEYVGHYEGVIPIGAGALTGAMYKSLSGRKEATLAALVGAGVMTVFTGIQSIFD